MIVHWVFARQHQQRYILSFLHCSFSIDDEEHDWTILLLRHLSSKRIPHFSVTVARCMSFCGAWRIRTPSLKIFLCQYIIPRLKPLQMKTLLQSDGEQHLQILAILSKFDTLIQCRELQCGHIRKCGTWPGDRVENIKWSDAKVELRVERPGNKLKVPYHMDLLSTCAPLVLAQRFFTFLCLYSLFVTMCNLHFVQKPFVWISGVKRCPAGEVEAWREGSQTWWRCWSRGRNFRKRCLLLSWQVIHKGLVCV